MKFTRIALAGLLVVVNTTLFSQRIDRMEPANWWIGMEHTSLQVLVYGENLGDMSPKVESYSLMLDSTVYVDNPNYLFLYLSVLPEAKAEEVPIDFYLNGRLTLTRNFQLRDREDGRSDIQGFNSSDVMYLITPDRFANGDPGNDRVEGMPDLPNRTHKFGRHGGDIKGIVDHLDYIADLGFTAIWLNPAIENDMPEYSYHGYAATDFYKIDARFGSNEEFKEFCEAARAKGIKIIMDMIMNHSGSEHWFVKDPPVKNWINNDGVFMISNHQHNTVQDIHASPHDLRHFTDGWFVETMPDLNQRNKLMADYLITNTLWWIEYSGISGIRMDTYPYPDKDFMTDWTCAVMKEYPAFSIVGEEWNGSPAIVSYWQRGKVNHDGYTSCLPSVMDFPLQEAFVGGLTQKEGWTTGITGAYKMLTHDFLYPDPNSLVTFLDNHDMERFFTQIDNDMDLYYMGLIFIATVRGTPQIYYGTEILMHSNGANGDHGIVRSDFPGGWAGDEVNGFSGTGLDEDQKAAQAYVKKLLNWRKGNKAVHDGELIHFIPKDGLYSYFRILGDQKVLVVLNKSDEAAGLALERYDGIISIPARALDVMGSADLVIDENYRVPPRSGVILELR